MTEEKVIQSKDLDLGFRAEICEKVGGADTLVKCIQCGVCSGGCTVAEYNDLQPHRVIAAILLGLKDEVLNSKAIWVCSICHKCTERCPKNVDISYILTLLRNMAVEAGLAPKDYYESVQALLDNGFVVPYTGGLKDNIDRRRNKFGLPEIIPPKLDELVHIVKETGLSTKIDKALKDLEGK